MNPLRPEISIDFLNERGSEYLPAYLSIEIIEVGKNSLSSRMPVKKKTKIISIKPFFARNSGNC